MRVFDRLEAIGVLASEELPDGKAFTVGVMNVGEGNPGSALLRVEASRTALACLSKPVEEWLRESVERVGNVHLNDGNKLAKLVAREPLRFDSRHVLL